MTAAPTTFPVYSYRTANGGALSFVTLRFHLHAVPAGTATIVNLAGIFALLGQVPGLTRSSALPFHRYRHPRPRGLGPSLREPTQRPDVSRRRRCRRDLGKRHTRVAERPAGAPAWPRADAVQLYSAVPISERDARGVQKPGCGTRLWPGSPRVAHRRISTLPLASSDPDIQTTSSTRRTNDV